MGINVQACNFALPTTLWVERIKRKLDKLQRGAQRDVTPGRVSLGTGKLRKGKAWAAARLLNRLADEWYRQFICWYYQWAGLLVLFDRHFVFDFAEDCSRAQCEPLSERIHRWFLNHLYPRPDLVILLDAPAELLYARKPEWSIEELEQKRQTLIRACKRSPHFFRVDATQPVEAVYAQVTKIIGDFIGRDFGIRKSSPAQTKRQPC